MNQNQHSSRTKNERMMENSASSAMSITFLSFWPCTWLMFTLCVKFIGGSLFWHHYKIIFFWLTLFDIMGDCCNLSIFLNVYIFCYVWKWVGTKLEGHPSILCFNCFSYKTFLMSIYSRCMFFGEKSQNMASLYNSCFTHSQRVFTSTMGSMTKIRLI